MPRYFFHVRHDTATMHDREGVELDDLEAVRNEVTTRARQSMSERILNGLNGLNGHAPEGRTFVVTDEQGQTVLTYSFMDAISP